MEQLNVGFALCGSFCTLEKAVAALELGVKQGWNVFPILSEITAATDTRFGKAADFITRIERACGRKAISTVAEAEPIGPKKLLDVLVICPCTGNTLGKLAGGITDGPVTMAAKAHLRNGRPLVLAIATNDGLSASAPNIGGLLGRKQVYFVPYGQDDCRGKPTSLVADYGLLSDTVAAALRGEQLQPLLLGAK
jgi:dipicolinate synthase subunit B